MARSLRPSSFDFSGDYSRIRLGNLTKLNPPDSEAATFWGSADTPPYSQGERGGIGIEANAASERLFHGKIKSNN